MKKQPVFFKRKQIITQLYLQRHCAFWVAGLCLLFVFLTAFNLWFWGLVQSWHIGYILTVQATLFLGAAVWATLWFSNRVAGPLFRMQQVLDRLAQGDFTARLYLRKNDPLSDLASAVNNTIQSLQDHAQRDANLALRISEKIKVLVSQMQQQQIAPYQICIALDELLPEVRHVASCYKMKF